MKKTTPTFFAVASIACLLATKAEAAVLVAPDAGFNWTDANAWSGGTATWNSTTPDSANFGAISSDRAANLVSAITTADIDFSNAANRWTVSGSGGQITLNGTLSKSGAGSVTISTNTLITGVGSVTVSGGELQLLNNANNFSGGVTLNSGTLRVGNNNGTGSPQTAGSLGTGTFTINGGTIFQNQGNVRTQAVAAVIGGNFALNSTAGGGLILGTTDGSRTVSLGSAARSITVSQSANGTGANAILALRDLTNSAGGAIVKEGEGVLRIQGTSTAGVTVNAGSLEVSGGLGLTNFTMNSGTVWRKTTATALTNGGAMTLDGASLVNNDTLANPRNSAFQTFQVSGTSNVFLGSGLTIQSTGTTTGGLTVRDGGVLGGNGTLRTAGTQSYLEGVTTLGSLTDSAITLSTGGSVRPGTPNSLNSTIGDLAFGSLSWNGEASPVAQMAFNLGALNASDQISLSGALTKGTGSNFVFDFLGYNGSTSSLFTLMTFDSQTGFVLGDFSATNITFDPGYSGQFLLNSGSLQYSVIPEPSTWALIAGAGAVFLACRRRRVA